MIEFAAGEDQAEGKLVFTRKEPEPIAVEWSAGKPAEAGSDYDSGDSRD